MNKIISFQQKKNERNNKNNGKFVLKAIINLNISKNVEGIFKANASSFSKITEDDILKILYKILNKISKKVPYIKLEMDKTYIIYFSIYYYENIENKNEFRYVFSPNMPLENVAEYLYLYISAAEYEENHPK